MSWDYRIMKRKNSEGDFEFGIYEVYYDENDKVSSWTEESITPVCSSADELENEIKFMMKAFSEDVLEYKEEE